MASVAALVSDEFLKIGLDNAGSGKADDINVSNDLGDDLLHDLDSYLEDINDRLTISRMVSDSIIKGMVNAVSQEAAEIVAAKEQEVASLKEVICLQQFGNCDTNASTALTNHDGLEVHKHNAESLSLLNQTVKEQIERFGQCTANMKGIPGNFEENLITKNDVDGAFNNLETVLKDVSQQVDIITFSPQSYIEEWKAGLDIRKEVEMMVFCTVLKGLQDAYEKQIWVGSDAVALIERFDELSMLRHELVSIQSCFVGPQVGNIGPEGSIEMDHPHRKVPSKHVSPSAQLWNRNGTCEEAKFSMPDNLDTSSMKHLNASDLYQHFKTVIIDMKREHESSVQQLTEENFSLKRDLYKKRELMKERLPFAAFKKDKDSETLRKRISDVIAKLDDIIKDSFKRQKAEALYLSQAFDDTKKLEALKCVLKDEHIEASVREEIYKCIIKELSELITVNCEDLDLKSVIMQDILGTVYGEVYCGGVASIQERCLEKDESLGFLQRKLSEIENELIEKEQENEELRLQTLVLEILLKDKEMVSLEVKTLHENERAQLTEEKNELRDQEALKNTELLSLTDKLEDCENQIEKLSMELNLTMDKLKSEEENKNFISVLYQNLSTAIKEKDNEHYNHMKSLGHVIQGLSLSFADFELRVKESIHWQNLRLENTAFLLHSLIPQIKVLGRTSSLYKERLENNLQKAETEVDLLGDEVVALLSLLEKIYVALDHYSPVLQHYTGIIDILNLIKIEVGIP